MSLYEDVKKKALMRLEFDGLSKCEAITSVGARWFNDPAGEHLDLQGVTQKIQRLFKVKSLECFWGHPVDLNQLNICFLGFAMDRYAYYVCFKCGKAYFGGEARCDLEAGGGDTFNPEELVCGGCSDVSQVSYNYFLKL